MKIAICQLNPFVGDIEGNTKKILENLEKAKKQKAEIVLFPELSICGYPPQDLLLYSDFILEMEKALKKIIEHTEDLFVVVGTVRKNPSIKGKKLFNTAAVIHNKKLLGYKDKTLLPSYDVFDDERYFAVGEKQKVWEYKHHKIAVLICEDMWSHAKDNITPQYERDPLEELKPHHPDLVLGLSASPYYFQKREVRLKVYQACARVLNCPLIVCNQVGANDQVVFDGESIFMDEKGQVIEMAKPFEEDFLCVETANKNIACNVKSNPIEELFQALVLGVRDYFRKLGFKKACLGLSGGIDSAVTLCIAKEALGKENVLALYMPSRFSSMGSSADAKALCKNLDVSLKEIPIDSSFQNFLDLLSPLFQKKKWDVTEENLQARIRGVVLMAVSNKLGYIVLSTGNKSEIAVGYCTLYGDMCGGLGVLDDVSKTLVYKLASYINKEKEIISSSIIKKEPSAELRENQRDSDALPPYSSLDTILTQYVEEHLSKEEISLRSGIEKEMVEDVVSRIYRAEYKRRQAPPGIRVTKKSFSKGRYFPIVQGWENGKKHRA